MFDTVVYFRSFSQNVKYIKMSDSVIISPSSAIEFIGTNGDQPSSTLSLTNNSSESKIFKVKTTNPKIFTVDPSYGILKAAGNALVYSICI
ncbi:hypothetical protein HZS_2371 [Henneguya salminicola]|nr:hypothetical protein HZS_2371 [Henneguya salminicola]